MKHRSYTNGEWVSAISKLPPSTHEALMAHIQLMVSATVMSPEAGQKIRALHQEIAELKAELESKKPTRKKSSKPTDGPSDFAFAP